MAKGAGGQGRRARGPQAQKRARTHARTAPQAPASITASRTRAAPAWLKKGDHAMQAASAKASPGPCMPSDAGAHLAEKGGPRVAGRLPELAVGKHDVVALKQAVLSGVQRGDGVAHRAGGDLAAAEVVNANRGALAATCCASTTAAPRRRASQPPGRRHGVPRPGWAETPEYNYT